MFKKIKIEDLYLQILMDILIQMKIKIFLNRTQSMRLRMYLRTRVQKLCFLSQNAVS